MTDTRLRLLRLFFFLSFFVVWVLVEVFNHYQKGSIREAYITGRSYQDRTTKIIYISAISSNSLTSFLS